MSAIPWVGQDIVELKNVIELSVVFLITPWPSGPSNAEVVRTPKN